MSRYDKLPRFMRRNPNARITAKGEKLIATQHMSNDYTDIVCVGGANDGRRMRIFEKHKTRTLQLAVARGKAVLHENYPGRQPIEMEIYSLTTICGVEIYMHNSLSPHTAVERMVQHYQRMP